jgi:hypothetical protein
MGSYLHSMLLCQGDRFPHHPWISCVKSTCNIGRSDVGDHLLIEAYFIGAETFSDIRINIDLNLLGHTPSSNTIWMAPLGQTDAQMPQPLQ